jgi:hypothetical protein
MQKKFNWNAIIELKKTIKNYAIPLAGTGLIFLQTNCDPNAVIITGLTLGGAIAYIQNTILKNEEKIKDKLHL